MKKAVLIISILSLLNVTCMARASSRYAYNPPEYTNDGFEVGNLDDVDINARKVFKTSDGIRRGKYKEVHSLLIYRHGRLVFEEYFTGHRYEWDGPRHHGELVDWNRSMPHCTHSVTKSIVSACIGIALDRGFIESVQQSVFDYLPEHRHLDTNGKDKITIEHLLTMTSGLEWDEWSAPLSSPKNDIVGIWFTENPVTFILDRPLVSGPGTRFNYSGGNMILLGEIIRHASGMNIDDFSAHYLFEPLGIDSQYWRLRFENGVFETGGGLDMTPRDMAKIGATFLGGGVWNGRRIISEQWVEKSAAAFPGNSGIDIPGEDSGKNYYSYSWWIKTYTRPGRELSMYSASGWGGQHIMVLPELDTVVVFTGGNFVTRRPPHGILEKYIIPAMD